MIPRNYRIDVHGVDNPQYFTGYSTDDDAVFVGIGNSAYEALEDALEQAAWDGWNVNDVPNTLSDELIDDELIEAECYFYVVLTLAS